MSKLSSIGKPAGDEGSTAGSASKMGKMKRNIVKIENIGIKSRNAYILVLD
jgi:hypothetical protein